MNHHQLTLCHFVLLRETNLKFAQTGAYLEVDLLLPNDCVNVILMTTCFIIGLKMICMWI